MVSENRNRDRKDDGKEVRTMLSDIQSLLGRKDRTYQSLEIFLSREGKDEVLRDISERKFKVFQVGGIDPPKPINKLPSVDKKDFIFPIYASASCVDGKTPEIVQGPFYKLLGCRRILEGDGEIASGPNLNEDLIEGLSRYTYVTPEGIEVIYKDKTINIAGWPFKVKSLAHVEAPILASVGYFGEFAISERSIELIKLFPSKSLEESEAQGYVDNWIRGIYEEYERTKRSKSLDSSVEFLDK